MNRSSGTCGTYFYCLTLPSETSYVNINEAARMGDLESIKSAFYHGTPVDQRDKYYKTPLMASCAHGNIEMAKILLDMG